jgi:hypothetical protein
MPEDLPVIAAVKVRMTGVQKKVVNGRQPTQRGTRDE